MTDKVVVLVSTASIKEARKIANTLVEERLAACVNVIPKIQSYYRWKGGVQHDEECLLVIKSSRPRFVALRKAIEKLHSYKVPEIICMQVVEGADPYMNWLEESLTLPAKPVLGRK
jgi:periplasmic divalent cation tolerance protein